MLDPKLIKENPEIIRSMLKSRAVEFDLDGLIELDKKRREFIIKTDELRKKKNQVAIIISEKKKGGDDISSILAEMKNISNEITELDRLISWEAAICVSPSTVMLFLVTLHVRQQTLK